MVMFMVRVKKCLEGPRIGSICSSVYLQYLSVFVPVSNLSIAGILQSNYLEQWQVGYLLTAVMLRLLPWKPNQCCFFCNIQKYISQKHLSNLPFCEVSFAKSKSIFKLQASVNWCSAKLRCKIELYKSIFVLNLFWEQKCLAEKQLLYDEKLITRVLPWQPLF